jgi:hypothetical protein
MVGYQREQKTERCPIGLASAFISRAVLRVLKKSPRFKAAAHSSHDAMRRERVARVTPLVQPFFEGFL